MGKSLCIHCDPYPENPAHYRERFEIFFAPLEKLFLPLERAAQKLPRLHAFLYALVWPNLFRFLLRSGLLREVELSDDSGRLFNRSLVLVREARRRRIPVKAIEALGRNTNFFSMGVAGVKYFFEGLPSAGVHRPLGLPLDDKGFLKTLLPHAGIPHPEGRVFRTVPAALRYVRTVIGFPVVVKPRSGSLSKHTSCNIQTEAELREALRIVRQISWEFVVEEFIEGGVYRITLVNGRMVACCLRERPHVLGDGTHTIRELIELKNRDPRRGDFFQRNCTLHKMSITPRTLQVLRAQNLTLESVPPKQKKAYVHDKVVLAAGADIHDKTDVVHPENRRLFERVAELCQCPLIGLDFMASDIARPWHQQRCAVIELNTLPYIDMHHYPVTGTPRNVAGCVLDYFIATHGKKTERLI